MSAPDMLAWAESYGGIGWRIFPVWSGQKTPAIKGWPDKASADPSVIESWWSREPFNIGLCCGPDSLFVVDVDQHGQDGEITLSKAEQRLGELPPTVEQRTGSGGRQLFFRYPVGFDLRNSASKLGPGLDSRGWHGYVVLPPSLHPCGERYQWIAPPRGGVLAELPARWARKLHRKPPPPTLPVPVRPLGTFSDAIVDRLMKQVQRAPSGARHATLYAVTSDLREKQTAGLVPSGDYEEDLIKAACNSGLSDAEARDTVAWAKRGRHG